MIWLYWCLARVFGSHTLFIDFSLPFFFPLLYFSFSILFSASRLGEIWRLGYLTCATGSAYWQVDRMSLLKITSLNVQCCNTSEKLSQLLAGLRKSKTQVAFLQETHFRGDHIPKLTNGAFPTAYNSVSPISKSKGVSILLAISVLDF